MASTRDIGSPRKLTRRQVIGGSAALAGALAVTRLSPVSAQEGETRLIQHAMGETEVPVNPQRVVVLDGPQLDAALMLGITPVGSTVAATGTLPGYLGDTVDGIEILGQIGEPDLEKIVQLQPDLILGVKFRHEEIYPQLSAIAPTVFSDDVGTHWKDDFTLFANALNQAEAGAAISSAFAERTATLGAAINAAEPGLTVSVVRFLASGVRIYLKSSYIGTILEDLSLARPESQDYGDAETRHDTISRERIRDVDASVIFVTVYGDSSETELDGYVSDPLWQQLTGVQNNRVYYVNDETWMIAIGYQAANLVLDDIEAFLLEDAPATPVPVS